MTIPQYFSHLVFFGLVAIARATAAEQQISAVVPFFPASGIHLGMTYENLLVAQPRLVSATLHPDTTNGMFFLHPGDSPTMSFQFKDTKLVSAAIAWDASRPEVNIAFSLKLREALQKAGKQRTRVRIGKLTAGDAVFEATGEFFDLALGNKPISAFLQASSVDVSVVIFDKNVIKDEGLYSSYQQLKSDIERNFSLLEAKSGKKIPSHQLASSVQVDFLTQTLESAMPRLTPPLKNRTTLLVSLLVVITAITGAAWLLIRKKK